MSHGRRCLPRSRGSSIAAVPPQSKRSEGRSKSVMTFWRRGSGPGLPEKSFLAIPATMPSARRRMARFLGHEGRMLLLAPFENNDALIYLDVDRGYQFPTRTSPFIQYVLNGRRMIHDPNCQNQVFPLSHLILQTVSAIRNSVCARLTRVPWAVLVVIRASPLHFSASHHRWYAECHEGATTRSHVFSPALSRLRA
jgi:hypothetical protein